MSIGTRRRLWIGALLALLASVTLLGGYGVLAYEPGTYRIIPNDTLPTVAARLGVPLEGLLRAHGLRAGDMLYVGRTLVVPQAPVATQHVIAPNETLDGIAARYGVAATQIAWRNGLTSSQSLISGRTLAIPDLSTVTIGPQATIARPTAGQRVPRTAPISGWGQSYDNELLVEIHAADGSLLAEGPAAIHAEIGQLGAFGVNLMLPADLPSGAALQVTVSHHDRVTGAVTLLDTLSLTLQ